MKLPVKSYLHRHFWDVDLKIPLISCVSCVHGITGNAPAAKSKQDADSPVEMPHKLHGWHARRKSDIEPGVHLLPKVNRMEVSPGGNAA